MSGGPKMEMKPHMRALLGTRRAEFTIPPFHVMRYGVGPSKTTQMTAVCNVNGEITPEAEARIPVLDRGFLFGDSVYEVLRTRGGIPFAWPEHLQRLRHSAAGIGLEIDLDDHAILRRIKDTLAAAAVPEAYIRLMVTRGTGSAPSIDLSHAPGPPSWVVMVRDLASLTPAPTARLALASRLRTDRASLDPGIKSGNYLNNLLGLAEAKARGATDCLFLNREGHITEASTSNFYLVADGQVHTAPPSAGILRGITRALLFDMCEEASIPMIERDIEVDELREADEMFLSSTLRDVVPVLSIDGEPVGAGEVGPMAQRLSELFEDYCGRRSRERYAADYEAV